MNAIEMLEQDHQRAKKAMQEIAKCSGSRKKDLFSALKHELQVHYRLEEDIFYPSVQAYPRCSGIQAKVKRAHQAVEDALAELAGLGAEDPDWTPIFNAMQGKLLKHVADEEVNLFVKIRSALSVVELNELGLRMQAQKDLQVQTA